MGNHCLFCERDLVKIIDQRDWYAIFDEFPVSKGHMLIISKRHVNLLDDLYNSEKESLVDMIIEVQTMLMNYYDPDGFNVGINLGSAAGQTIPHLHIHVIPRYKGDVETPRGGVRGVIPNKQKY